jgi:hypothetical protein
MTTQSEHPTDYEQTLDDAQECLGDIAELAWKFPISSMIDYARQSGLPEAIIARLEDIAEAAAKLVHHAPDAIWDFAKAAGMTDELTAREQEREDEHRAAVEGPNGLFQIMRQKHEEKMLSVQNPSVD